MLEATLDKLGDTILKSARFGEVTIILSRLRNTASFEKVPSFTFWGKAHNMRAEVKWNWHMRCWYVELWSYSRHIHQRKYLVFSSAVRFAFVAAARGWQGKYVCRRDAHKIVTRGFTSNWSSPRDFRPDEKELSCAD